MNAITHALKQIRWEIPLEILTNALEIDIPPESRYTTSLDDKIVTRIIRGKVLADTNLINGIETFVSLDGIQIKYDKYYNGIFEVPMERTNGRLMINVLGVGSVAMTGNNGYLGGSPQLPMSGSNGVNGCCNVTTYLSNQANRIYNSFKGNFSDYNPNCTLIGPNVIMVSGLRFFSGNSLAARVNLENDNNLNNLNTKSFRYFNTLCVLAAKSFIYNQLIVKMGNSYLSGGQELGPFQSVVENYSSAEEDYRVYMEEVWGKVLYLNDPDRKNRFIHTMLNTNF